MADYGNSIIPFNSAPEIYVTDVADTLRCASNDLARQNQFRLCVHNNINMFSLNKPVSLPDYFPSRGDEQWCKGIGLNYGIVIPSPSTTDNLPNSAWVYDRPTGPYRLHDFVGYRHKAPTPYYRVPTEIYTNKDLQNNKATACYPMSQSGTVGFDKYKIQLSAASGGNQNFYAAIFIRDSSNDGGYIKTHHSPISGGDDNIEFDLHGLPAKYQQGQLRVCCFIANKAQVDWISATRLPLGFLCWGGYGTVNYTTYVTTYKYPAELIAELDGYYAFVDIAEPVLVRITNKRTDGQSIDLRDGVQANKVKIDYEVTSASGETSKVTNTNAQLVSGSAVLAPNQSCVIRFDKMQGYTENGQPSFPPQGFTGWSYATLWYQRRNDIGTSTMELLININIQFTASGL